ncbi:unnamed protein product, partial [Adineta steineri]
MPDADEPIAQTTTKSNEEINEVLLQQLMDMGFSIEACKKALLTTGNNNIEAAMNWVFEHQSDPDFNEPYKASNISLPPIIDEESIALVMSMGFSRPHATRALTMTNNSVEAAADWALNNPENDSALHMLVDSLPQSSPAHHVTKTTHFRDGNGKYRLVAFISHIGNTTACGHYVAHILKDGRWV